MLRPLRDAFSFRGLFISRLDLENEEPCLFSEGSVAADGFVVSLSSFRLPT